MLGGIFFSVPKIFGAVPQSTQTEGACIIVDEPAESASSIATSPGNLSVCSQDASTQCCVGARFVVTRSEYTQTDPVLSKTVPQPFRSEQVYPSDEESLNDPPFFPQL